METEIQLDSYKDFIDSIKNRVRRAQQIAVRSVNTEMIMLYWHIGKSILEKQEQQGWGTKVIDSLSADLMNEFPGMKGFSSRNLKYMRLFASEYADEQIVQQVAAQLPWWHNVILLDKVKSKVERIWYLNKSLEHGWSRNTLVYHIETDLYKRQGGAITNFSNVLPAPNSDLAQQTLKDPYIFDFLTIGSEAHERDIEKALVDHVQKFLLELGVGFAFVGRQYHLKVGSDDFFVDLLFYHLKLRCFVVIELKATKFTPQDAGQLNFYLSVIDDQLRHETDNPSIGIILCKDKGEQVTAEYALRGINKPIGISSYQFVKAIPEELKSNLPTIEQLEKELNESN